MNNWSPETVIWHTLRSVPVPQPAQVQHEMDETASEGTVLLNGNIARDFHVFWCCYSNQILSDMQACSRLSLLEGLLTVPCGPRIWNEGETRAPGIYRSFGTTIGAPAMRWLYDYGITLDLSVGSLEGTQAPPLKPEFTQLIYADPSTAQPRT